MLGLLAAVTWGAADFAGGLATRRTAPSRVVLIAHGTSFLLLALVSLRLPTHLPLWAVVYGLLSGVSGGVALMLFYEALSLGAMGLSAALAGLITAVLPVVIAIHSQGLPAPLQLAGFAVAAASIVLIAYAPAAPGTAPARRTLLFATLAGLGFGLQLIWLHTAASVNPGRAFAPTIGVPSDSTAQALAPILRALLLSRLGGTGIAVAAQLVTLARHRTRLLPAIPGAAPSEAEPLSARFSLPATAALAGLLDTSGNGLYMLSSLTGRLDVAAVLSSLYPGATIVLAAVFLRERATWLQALGMACALVAVGLIAA